MKNIIIKFILFISFFTYSQEAPRPIHVKVSGKGDPVMLIPGFTVPGESWTAIVEQLEKNYQCHVITLAGFGGTEPIGFPWLPKVNQALENYIADLQLEGLTIIGHSLGGTLATWLASRNNNKISRLILVDALPAAGALMFPDYDPDNLVYESPYNRQQLSMTETDFDIMATGMSQGMSLNPEVQKKIKGWMVNADRETYVYGYTDYLKLDMREGLKNITAPVTILAADQPFGKEMVMQTYESQYSNLSHYDLIIADNSAHFVMFDKPEWFMGQIQQILATD